MATQQLMLVNDSSTLANFVSWAQPISAFFATCGWQQSSDTGQVNWGTLTTIPGNGAYVYEVWQPNDALPAYFLKVEYGNYSGSTNSPTVRLTLGTTTNGSGTITNNIIGPFYTSFSAYTAAGTGVQWPCYFSGTAGRMAIMMWRNGPNGCPMSFAVERSITSSGVYTGTHVTLMAAGCGTSAYGTYQQQTLLFGVGVAPAPAVWANNNYYRSGCLPIRWFQPGQSVNGVYNAGFGFDTVAPYIGQWDQPLTSYGSGPVYNFVEGQSYTIELYGQSITYIATQSGYLGTCSPNNSSAKAGFFCMRIS